MRIVSGKIPAPETREALYCLIYISPSNVGDKGIAKI